METPQIVWDEGKEPTSPLESHPAVRALRQGGIGLAMAYNTGDFTIAQLTDNWTTEYVRVLADSYPGGIVLYPGPRPFQPLRIVSESERGTVVEICSFQGDSDHVWAITEKSPGGRFVRESTTMLMVELVYENGRLKIPVTGYSLMESPCDGTAIPVGRFKDQPVFPETIPTAPVREPLPTSTGK